MAPTPAASPSSPSTKLMALTVSSVMPMVSTTLSGPERQRPDAGQRDA